MGLIERLNGPADSDSVFARAFALRDGRRAPEEEPDTDGSVPDLPAGVTLGEDGSVDAGAAVRALLKELQVQRSFGITTPSHLFSLLHRHLHVDRGAFLVPAPEDEFLPAATAGLDRTSALRLRITGPEIEALIEGPKVVILSGAQRALFSDRLSRGDYRRSPRIALFPFFHLKRLLATLIVFGSPILELDPAVLDVILGALSDGAGRMLFDGRHRPLGNRSRSVVLRPDQAADTVKRLSRGPGNDTTSLSSFQTDLTPLVNLVREVHPHLDHSRLVEDMIDTTALLVSDTHDVVHYGGGRILFLGRSVPTIDTGLLVHLISTTIAHLFGVAARPVLDFQERSVDEIARDS